MPKICYVPKNFNDEQTEVIRRVNAVITDYARQGFTLSLRQVYYVFVANDFFPESRKFSNVGGDRWVRDPNGTTNATPNYKWLGDIVADARLAGKIDWLAIEDRTRFLRSEPHWSSPKSILDSVVDGWAIDKWSNQDCRPEVWIEKDALVGIVESVCSEMDVPFFSCRGYTSASEMWVGAQRLKGYIQKGQKPVIFHLGDHDPSGIDMTRDILDRMNLFMGGTELERLALNMDQVEQYDPPPNPAKITDPRCGAYVRVHGGESWELDALEPRVLADIIRRAILSVRDEDDWNEAVEAEEADRARLAKVRDNFDELTAED